MYYFKFCLITRLEFLNCFKITIEKEIEKSRPPHNDIISHSSSLTHPILFFELAPNEPDNQLKEHFSALIAARRLQLRSSLIELESFRLVVSEFASTRLPLFAIHRLDDDIVHVKNDPLTI